MYANFDSIIIYFVCAGGQCVENSTQLHGELAQTEGFVLICLGGFWGKIRRGSAAAAKVVCRQLGFSTESY